MIFTAFTGSAAQKSLIASFTLFGTILLKCVSNILIKGSAPIKYT